MIATKSDPDIVRAFLALPREAFPVARWLDDDLPFHCWLYLRDFLLPENERRFNHIGDKIRLYADREGWREGIVVRAG